MPDPKAWMLSGLAVDSFHIFWGNSADGATHGSLCKGSRKNIGLSSDQMVVKALHTGLPEVRGVTTTGTQVFWLAPEGVYGDSKASSVTVADKQTGLIAAAPSGLKPWNPMGIAWDGGNVLYFTDSANGIIYTLPSQSIRSQSMSKFVEAPDVQSLAVLQYGSLSGNSGKSRAASQLPFTGIVVAVLSLACLS